MKIKIFTIIFLSILLFVSQANAQKDYWEKAEAKYQSDYRQRIVDNMNMTSSSVKSTTWNSGNGISSNYVQTASDKEYEANRKLQEKLLRDKITKDNYSKETYKFHACLKYYNQIIANKPIIEDLDIKEYCQWMYADNYADGNFSSFVTPYIQRLRQYKNDKINTNIDSALNRLWDARCFPSTCLVEFEKLKKIFPNSIEKIEKQELRTMPYFFGALFPEVEDPVDYEKGIMSDKDFDKNLNYPRCQYQLLDLNDQIKILNKFLSLCYKYPIVLTESNILKARKQYNPLYLIQSFKRTSTPSKELVFELNKMSLFSKFEILTPSTTIVNGSNSKQEKEIKAAKKAYKGKVFYSMYSLVYYFRYEYPLFIYSITAKQWQEIAIAKGLSIEELGDIFYMQDYEKKPLKDFPNYQNALKGNFEINSFSGFNSMRIDNSHTYEGNFENGTPNGQGKFTSSDRGSTKYGFTIEGNFKNGIPLIDCIQKNFRGEISEQPRGLDLNNKSSNNFYLKEL